MPKQPLNHGPCLTHFFIEFDVVSGVHYSSSLLTHRSFVSIPEVSTF